MSVISFQNPDGSVIYLEIEERAIQSELYHGPIDDDYPMILTVKIPIKQITKTPRQGTETATDKQKVVSEILDDVRDTLAILRPGGR